MGKSSRQKVASKKSAKPVRKAKANGRGTLNGGRGAVHAKAPPSKPVPKPARKKPVAKPVKRTPFVLSSIVLPEGYRPSEDEPFMNARHRAYFRNKLVAWKEEIVRQNRETLHVLHEDSAQHADLADRATSETDRALELRARDRQRKLIAKIDAALARLEEGTYGYCEETGDPIGLKRLDARPIATLSLEAQERHERREKVFRED
jgi:DnaK suppressor protein